MMKKVILVILSIIMFLGLVGVILSIVGIATKDWITLSGNTNELQKKFDQLTDPTGPFIRSLVVALSPLSQSVIIGIVNQTLVQVEKQLSANLETTTYSLFDKKVSNTTAKEIAQFDVPQGLIIAGLVCLFIGTIAASLIAIFNLGKVGFLRSISPIFLVLGSILILIGYLLFTKIIVEDFGHDLGIKSELGASFILVVLSSVIGFLTAVLVASTMFWHRNRSDNIIKAPSMQRKGQVAMEDRHGVVVTTQTSKTTKVQNNDDQF